MLAHNDAQQIFIKSNDINNRYEIYGQWRVNYELSILFEFMMYHICKKSMANNYAVKVIYE